MLLHARSKDRPYHWGPFPLEVLTRDEAVIQREEALPPVEAPRGPVPLGPLAQALRHYRELYAGLAEAEKAKQPAPVPDDPERRAADVKGCGYFMNASQIGICRIPENAWCVGAPRDPHAYAIVILVEHGRVPESDNLACEWVAPAEGEAAEMRAAEIAVCIARHIRAMGFAARADVPGHAKLDHARLAVLAGLAWRRGGAIVNPFVGERFALAAISTEYALAQDRPLSDTGPKANGFRYWLGINGATSGRERRRQAKRASHLSRFPMETVKRVDRPTTLILDDEVPRVSKRAAFFERALQGDLGEKSKLERSRFSFKHPVSWAQLGMIRALVPHQDGPVAASDRGRYADAGANTRAIKSLSYFLGADLTGICEIPTYAWYSHKTDGKPLTPYHRYAVVMLIDQEFDTMEGASGDDWISGAQSMRAYLRGAEIAGVMAETMRALGFPARSQTNADSDVLHIPLVLWAGLGELSRIGELVLNPFVGPRFKSVVLTTDMPLVPDKPIDFGLQYFCSNCLKCARECPCDAIPWGDKVMFNGYEMWKPDVERCTRYRLTNSKGSACGRCMKTCPLNKVVDADGPILTRIASWCGVNAMWLKPLLVPIATWLDDRIGNGKRNPAKKWWFDHEIVGGVTIAAKGTNQRDIDPSRKLDPAKQKIAYYHANMMPPPDEAKPVPLDRKSALAAADLIETPDEARLRKARGGSAPVHYTPTPPAGRTPAEGETRVKGPFEAASRPTSAR
jgi:epoxyqueuosine reductase QueG